MIVFAQFNSCNGHPIPLGRLSSPATTLFIEISFGGPHRSPTDIINPNNHHVKRQEAEHHVDYYCLIVQHHASRIIGEQRELSEVDWLRTESDRKNRAESHSVIFH